MFVVSYFKIGSRRSRQVPTQVRNRLDIKSLARDSENTGDLSESVFETGHGCLSQLAPWEADGIPMTAAIKRKVYGEQFLDDVRNRMWLCITLASHMTCSHPKSFEQPVQSARIYLHIDLAACLSRSQFCFETQYINKLSGKVLSNARKVNMTHRPHGGSAVPARRRVS
jgi:hypothetical protein